MDLHWSIIDRPTFGTFVDRVTNRIFDDPNGSHQHLVIFAEFYELSSKH